MTLALSEPSAPMRACACPSPAQPARSLPPAGAERTRAPPLVCTPAPAVVCVCARDPGRGDFAVSDPPEPFRGDLAVLNPSESSDKDAADRSFGDSDPDDPVLSGSSAPFGRCL